MTRDPRPASPLRCGLVWLGTTAALVALGAWLLPDPAEVRTLLTAHGLAGQPFDQVLVRVCEAALLVASGWLWVVATVVVLDAARGRSRRRRGVPAPLRRLVLGACGVAVAGGLLTPAYAVGAVAGDGRGTEASVVSGLPLPDRATAAMHVSRLVSRRARSAPAPQPNGAAGVVVRPGDTLWALAEDTLPPGATDASVAGRWRLIYRLNRATVGPDPDLIRPAQHLRLPRK